MGLRLIFILAALWVVYLVVRRLLAERSRSRPPGEEGRATVEMVRCAHCGTHLPRPEAIREGSSWYCSGEHRDLAHGRGRGG